MVRENERPSDGVDANKNVELEKVLKDENLWTGDQADPQGYQNTRPIDIRADIEPEKKGSKR